MQISYYNVSGFFSLLPGSFLRIRYILGVIHVVTRNGWMVGCSGVYIILYSIGYIFRLSFPKKGYSPFPRALQVYFGL